MTTIIGLTGGIGCGKSLVSRYLQSKHYTVIDADVIARQIMEPGNVGLSRVREAFGPEILQADGTLNRRRLGEIVFGDSKQLERLNALTHPLIERMMKAEVGKHEGEALVIVDVPLLLESGGYKDWVDEIWVVTATPEKQLSRIMERDGMSAQQAKARIAAQWPTAKKAALADFVIDNSASPEQTYQQVDALLKRRR